MWATPLLVVPGSKDTLADLRWMRSRGLHTSITAAAARGIPVLGLCGGFQILGRTLSDPGGTGGTSGVVDGLGLLNVHTRFEAQKQVRAVTGTTHGGWLLPAGLSVSGYEIHQGHTPPGTAPMLTLDAAEGAICGLVAGTYLHGLLDSGEVRQALVERLRVRKGLPPLLDKAAARFDDLLDLIPARLTAVLMLVLADGDRKRGLRCLVRDARTTDSPNAGWPMAAMAEILGVQLTRRDQYALGDDLRPIRGSDVRRCWKVARRAMIAAAFLAGGALLV